ncbi:uncharacterized protein [Drosophila virilis]|uniref:uncharacterized protein n=1 Tax=Drosophila virilis TaxID=7244 RepID=UPI0038B31C06
MPTEVDTAEPQPLRGCSGSTDTINTGEKYGRRNNLRAIQAYRWKWLGGNWELRQFQTMLEEISEDARYRDPLVIAGDFNAWAVEWGSKKTNARATTLVEEFAALDLGLANDGQELTYCKAGRGSIIDLTLLSSSLYRLTTWKVSNEFTFSDHRAVHFEIHGKGRRKQQPKTTGPKWKDNGLDEETYTDFLRHAQWTWATELANDMVWQIMENISDACDLSVPRRMPSKRGVPCYW